MPINWNLDASSLTNIARHNFRELGKIMNTTQSFTISAIGIQSVGLGDFNQRFDLLHIPNMGGYRFSIAGKELSKMIIQVGYYLDFLQDLEFYHIIYFFIC